MVETEPSSARGEGLIPGQGAKIHMPCSQKTTHEKHKQYFNKLKALKDIINIKRTILSETFYKTLMVAKICLKKRHKNIKKKKKGKKMRKHCKSPPNQMVERNPARIK